MGVGDLISDYVGIITEEWSREAGPPPFEKIITNMLDSNTPQEMKMKFFYASIDIKEFRKYVHENYPQYSNRIKLWEILHGVEKTSA